MKTFRIKIVDTDGCPATLELRAENAERARVKAVVLITGAQRSVLAVEEAQPSDQSETEV